MSLFSAGERFGRGLRGDGGWWLMGFLELTEDAMLMPIYGIGRV